MQFKNLGCPRVSIKTEGRIPVLTPPALAMPSSPWQLLLLASLSLGPTAVLCQTFNLQDNYVGDKFFSDFTWFTGADPTHGRVDYVDMNTAKSSNLSYGM